MQRQVTIDVANTVVNASHNLRMTATSGSLSSDADLTLTVADSLLPQVTVTSPVDGQVFTGSREVDISGTLSAVSELIGVTVSGVMSVVTVVSDMFCK